jgi:hypothetical protein
MTPAERLQPAVTAVYNAMNGNIPAQAPYDNIRKFLDGDLEMLAYAKGEIERLRDRGKRGVLAETDYESKIRCQALERIVQLYEEVP